MGRVVSFLGLAFASGSSDLPKIRARGRWFVDPAGRVRIFHGFNDVQEAKGTGHTEGGTDYLPQILMNTSNMDVLAEMGFNVFRVPMMWSGAEPSLDNFDDDYINAIAGVVDELASRGMYGFLDMHQDVLSSLLGSYDGAPQWLVNQTKPRRAYPWPLKAPLSNWAFGYLSEATGQAFQELYDNVHGGVDAWAGFWRRTASTFRGKGAVLGYELMNEPFAGDVYAHPSIILPGEAGRRNLMPAYDRVASAIREVDNETIVMFEPMMGVALAAGGELGSGFTSVPGGAAYADRSCLSWHYYCLFLNSDYSNSSEPMPPLRRAACHRGMGPQVFNSVVHDAEKLNTATMLTEFGALVPDDEHPDGQGSEEIEWVMNQADATFQSWTYWDIIALKDPRGGFKANKIDAFIRPYASAIAGIPTKMAYDRDTGIFNLEFQLDVSISEPTEVVVPALRYPSGFDVSLSSGLSTEACPDGNVAKLCVRASSLANGELSTITVTPKHALTSLV